jgi:drug/metabolite transporter (DMT)-like permease
MSSAVRPTTCGWAPLTVVAWTTLIGSLILLPIALAFDSLGEFARLDDRLLGYWLYTAIFPVGVAFLGLTAGLERLGVSRVMVYMYLIPVAGVGLSAAVFRRSADRSPRAGRPDRAFGRHSDARCARPRGAGSCMNGLPT